MWVIFFTWDLVLGRVGLDSSWSWSWLRRISSMLFTSFCTYANPFVKSQKPWREPLLMRALNMQPPAHIHFRGRPICSINGSVQWCSSANIVPHRFYICTYVLRTYSTTMWKAHVTNVNNLLCGWPFSYFHWLSFMLVTYLRNEGLGIIVFI